MPDVWRPTAEDLSGVLREQNPWHTGDGVPTALAPQGERPLVVPLARRLLVDSPRRFHVVLGPRRVGKTTVMYQVVDRLLEAGVEARRLWWLRLDHPLLVGEDLGLLLRTVLDVVQATPERPVFVFLDEVVYAPGWDLWLKTFYDERWPVRIVATSSAAAALRTKRMESGVGRWEEHRLGPCLLSEYVALRGAPASLVRRDSLAEAITQVVADGVFYDGIAQRARELLLLGGFPELLVDDKVAELDERSQLLSSQRTLRSDAIERAVYKDIPQSFALESPLQLERVLYTVAGQVGGILSPTSTARDLGLTQPTLDRYISYLEQTFLVFLLPNYSGSEARVQRRGRKIYFVDPAVRNAALQRGSAPLDNHAEMGLLRENMVAAHLHALAAQTGARLCHWRHGSREVDLVYDHPERPLAFEIASSATHRRDGLRAFRERHARFADGCYLVAPDVPALLPRQASDGLGRMPLDLLLLVAGVQAQRALLARLLPTSA